MDVSCWCLTKSTLGSSAAGSHAVALTSFLKSVYILDALSVDWSVYVWLCVHMGSDDLPWPWELCDYISTVFMWVLSPTDHQSECWPLHCCIADYVWFKRDSSMPSDTVQKQRLDAVYFRAAVSWHICSRYCQDRIGKVINGECESKEVV